LSEIRSGSGSQFWRDAVEGFLSLPVDELEAVRHVTREVSA
jgi:hypothetical protein